MRRFRTSLAAGIGLCALALTAPPAQAAPPTIASTSFSGTTTTSATLQAEINPQGKATKYRFEYGLADCSANPCTSTVEAIIPIGTTPVLVGTQIEGLDPETTYHFRVLAENTAKEEAQGKDTVFKTHALPPVFGPCPNDAFRQGSSLPDCRAYEQASPTNKNGGNLWSAPTWLDAAAQGAVTFFSDAGIPGGVGSQELPLYLAIRGEEGWQSKGLLPPAEVGQQANVIGWLPGLSEVFVIARRVGAAFTETLLSRASKDASLATIVPHTPLLDPSSGEVLYHYAGASDGGSKVLFESKAQLTPGAVKGISNLYLWDRATGELHLAGALNDAGAPPKGAFAGPYDWFKGTTPQTLLKGGSTADYYVQEANAISGDGKEVFFTEASTGKLYLRKNPTEEQSATDLQGKCTEPLKACTIQINASQKDNGKGPGKTDAAGAAPAAFQAASADGKVAYFTSSEKLTNDANTGVEPEPAAIVRSDLDGKPESIEEAFIPTRAGDVEVDGTHIYWVNLAKGTIARAKLDGKGIEDEFITATDNLKGIEVHGEHIYWANGAEITKEEETTKVEEGTIGKAKLNGEGPASEVDQSFVEGAGNPHAVAVNATHVYWTNDPTTESGFRPGFVGRAKASDGEEVNSKLTETLISVKEQAGIALDAEHVYWMTQDVPGDGGFSRISRAELDGNDYLITFIFFGEGKDGKEVEVVGERIYWTVQGSELIGRAKLNGEEPASEVEHEFIKDAGHPVGLAVDSNHLYWSSNGDTLPNPGNDLYRYETETGELTDLSVDSLAKAGAEVRGVLGASEDGSRVYFVANGVLAPGATAGSCKGTSGNDETGACNVYLADEEGIELVARLDAEGANWRPTMRSGNSIVPRTSRLSPDGQTLLFTTGAIGGSSFPPGAERHLYDAQSKTTTCITCNPTGEPGGQSTPIFEPSQIAPSVPAPALSQVLSEDGRRVFFETTAALVGEDVNGLDGCPEVGGQSKFPICQDVYEWEAEGSGSCEAPGGCIYLLSTGKEKDPSFFAGASPSGDDVFIFTRSQLVPQDKDHLRDVYDVRVLGGLASQHPSSQPPCLAEACKPAIEERAQGESAPSATFQGPPDPPVIRKKAPRCPKGRRLVRSKGRSRCVVKRKQRGVKNRKAKRTKSRP